MCWMCDHEARAKFTLDYQNGLISGLRVHAGQASGKALDGMLLTGHDIVPPQLAALIITVDAQPDDTTTTATIAVGDSLISTIDTIGDQDFFRVELVAGQTYEIGQYLTTEGPNAVPLADAYIELYDSAGNLIVSADGGGPNTPSGLDALLSYTAAYSGTYYINARSYDQDPTNGTTGDFVGDYELFVREASPFSYRPYYDTDSPLHAIDWGSQVDGSSRNPDGEEGERVTGNAFTGHAWNPYGIEGKNVIYYYFAKQGEVFISEDPANPGLENMVAAGFRDWEKNAYEMALGEYEKIADVVYIEVSNRNEADFIFITYDGTPNVGVLGRMSPPDEQNEGQTEFNRNGPGWNEDALKPGGFSFQTLMHELGHGHGLAHPHDGGGRSSVMRGVEAEGAAFDYTTGDFDLNQGVYTIMSYEDGWQTRPAGHGAPATTSTYGWMGTLGALDIAVLQDKYGVNEEWATGNDVYVLKDANVDGTFYQAIWDAGGSDMIVYQGGRDTVIDLRPATLRYEVGGGGFMSYAFGIHGGFTIANGVTIENAYGGSGNDILVGNDAHNLLFGGAGTDAMRGGKGNDVYYVDNSNDKVFEAAAEGHDVVYSEVSYRLAAGQHVEILSTRVHSGTESINLFGNELDNLIYGNAGANLLVGGFGADIMIGFGGNDTYHVHDSRDMIHEGPGGGVDTVYAYVSYWIPTGQHIEVLSASNHAATSAIELYGNELANTIMGNAGANVLFGGGGADRLVGFSGDDRYYVDNAGDIVQESSGGGRDTVYSSVSYSLAAGVEVEVLSTRVHGATDAIDLTGNEFANLLYGNAGANVLNGGGGADVLRGFGGADAFAFTTALGAGNIDSIVDFQTGLDEIRLDDAIFGGLAFGDLNPAAFHTGAAAADADDRIIYDSSNGALYYDADGAGGAAAIQFATLQAGLNLSASDFTVI